MRTLDMRDIYGQLITPLLLRVSSTLMVVCLSCLSLKKEERYRKYHRTTRRTGVLSWRLVVYHLHLLTGAAPSRPLMRHEEWPTLYRTLHPSKILMERYYILTWLIDLNGKAVHDWPKHKCSTEITELIYLKGKVVHNWIISKGR